MVEELTAPATASRSLPAVQVYVMAALCLAAGLAVGYLGRDSHTIASAPRAASTAAPPSSPHMAAKSANTPTLEDMKHMADKQAAPLLEKLKSDPNNSALLTQVGAFYHASHQFKEASSYYERAAQIEPKNVALRNRLASSLYRSGDVDGAIAQLNQALSYDPKDANSLFNLGMIKLQGKRDGKGAVAAWQKLLKSNPQLSEDRKAEVQKLMADVLTSLGNQHAMEGVPKQ
jgi:cytochrome c-type biogenesis protein CcmH/NrfG